MFPDVVSEYPFKSIVEDMESMANTHWVYYSPTREGKTHLMEKIMVNRLYGRNVSQMGFADTMNEIEEAQERLEILRDHRDSLESAGTDEYPDGTVIKFIRPLPINGIPRKLTYVAIKKADAWFVTGATGPNEVSWEQLVLWAGPDNIADREIVKEWESR